MSIWMEDVTLPRFPALKGDRSADVLVIGGGLTGLLCAHYVQEAGLSCILAEAKNIMGGVSGRTTAKITSQHGLIYGKIQSIWGRETARLYYRANQDALEEYRLLRENIDCDFETQDAWLFSRRSAGSLEEELAVLRDIGAEASLEQHLDLPFPVKAGLKFPRQAQFHPLKFAAALAEDLTIYEHTPVTALHGSAAVTPGGVIRANHIITATHFPFLRFRGGYFAKLYQQRSYVLALEDAPSISGMYLEAEENGLSLRRQGDVLLLGGGGHRTGENGGGFSTLEQAAEDWFPQAAEVSRWATQDCVPPDHLPYIGNYGPQDQYVATGFQKWGMTTAMAAALMLRDEILKKPRPWESVFSPQRRLYWPAIGQNTRNAGKHLLTFSRPRCTHLGCALKWNAQEKTWDCPCHGSRYGENGNVLNGPAERGISTRGRGSSPSEKTVS